MRGKGGGLHDAVGSSPLTAASFKHLMQGRATTRAAEDNNVIIQLKIHPLCRHAVTSIAGSGLSLAFGFLDLAVAFLRVPEPRHHCRGRCRGACSLVRFHFAAAQ